MTFLDGRKVVSYDTIVSVREAIDSKKSNDKAIQAGGQENILSSDADIVIGGGCRGGGKSWVLLNSVLYDIYNPNFRSVILRAGTDDLSDLVDVSFDIFRDFGEYNKSKDDMTWNYKNGGWLKFSFHAGTMESFRTRFQGKQFAYILSLIHI